MAKVQIDRDQQGWFCAEYINRDASSDSDPPRNVIMRGNSYPHISRLVRAAGHDIQSAGWKHRMLSWNWNNHAMDGYPEWQIEKERAPAFVKLTHTRRDTKSVESQDLAAAWDDIAEVDFYQRDWTDNGIPFVSPGETYWSGWWFATIAERDRFLAWRAERS